MKKIFLLLMMLVGTSLMAVTTDGSNVIYVNTIQEVDMYAKLIDGISLFFYSGGTTGDYFSLIKTIALFGTVLTLLRGVTQATGGGSSADKMISAGGGSPHSSLMGLVSYQIFIVMLLMVMFGSSTETIVKHPNSGKYETTANLPTIFAYTMSFFTKLNYSMSNLSSNVYSGIMNDPGILSTSDVYSAEVYSGKPPYGVQGLGYGALAANLKDIYGINLGDLNTSDGGNRVNLSSMARHYMQECVIMPLANHNPEKLAEIKAGITDIDQLSSTTINSDITVTGGDISSYKVFDVSGSLTGCDSYWATLKPLIDNIKIPRSLYKTEASLYYFNQISSTLNGGAGAGVANLLKDASEVQTQITLTAVGNEFDDLYQDLGTAGNVFAAGARKSTAEIQLNGMGIGTIMGEYLPVFASFIFMIMVASFPIIFAFSFMPGGFTVLANFIKTLAWISLWTPMSNILNFFMDYRLAQTYMENGGGGNIETAYEPLSNMVSLSSEAALMAGLAGFLYASVPALSWMLVKGGGEMLGNITSTFSNAMQQNMNAGAVADNAKEAGALKAVSNAQGLSASEAQYYKNSAEMRQGIHKLSGDVQHTRDLEQMSGGAAGADMASAAAGQYEGRKSAGNISAQSDAWNSGEISRDFAKGAGTGGVTKDLGMMASTDAFGGNTSVADAKTSGAFQGKLEASTTTSLASTSQQVSKNDIESFGVQKAGEQVRDVKAASKVLDAHGGQQGFIDSGVATAEYYANQSAGKSKAHMKADMANVQSDSEKMENYSIGYIEALGSNENLSAEYAKELGEEEGDIAANTMNAKLNNKKTGLKNLSKTAKEKFAKVDGGKVGASILAISGAQSKDGSSIGADEQLDNTTTMEMSKIEQADATILGANGDSSYRKSQRGKAEIGGARDKANFSRYADASTSANQSQSKLESDLSGEGAKQKGAQKTLAMKKNAAIVDSAGKTLKEDISNAESEEDVEKAVNDYNNSIKGTGAKAINEKDIKAALLEGDGSGDAFLKRQMDDVQSISDDIESTRRDIATDKESLRQRKKTAGMYIKAEGRDKHQARVAELESNIKNNEKKLDGLYSEMGTAQQALSDNLAVRDELSASGQAGGSISGAIQMALTQSMGNNRGFAAFAGSNLSEAGGNQVFSQNSQVAGAGLRAQSDGTSTTALAQSFGGQVKQGVATESFQNYAQSNMGANQVANVTAAQQTMGNVAMNNVSQRTGITPEFLAYTQSASQFSSTASGIIAAEKVVQDFNENKLGTLAPAQQQRLQQAGYGQGTAMEDLAILNAAGQYGTIKTKTGVGGSDLTYGGKFLNSVTGSTGVSLRGDMTVDAPTALAGQLADSAGMSIHNQILGAGIADATKTAVEAGLSLGGGKMYRTFDNFGKNILNKPDGWMKEKEGF